jgi:NAD(P)-dependent dehydrogenase (short-subunit alcohol dehydrogenase family)
MTDPLAGLAVLVTGTGGGIGRATAMVSAREAGSERVVVSAPGWC